MLHPVSNLVKRNCTDIKKRPLNILCWPTHEGYQSMLAETGHNFFMITHPKMKPWDFHTRPVPKNHYLLTKNFEQIAHDLEIDLILSQERFSQLPVANNLKKMFCLPVVHLEHIEPQPKWSSGQFEQMKQMNADVFVFITEHNKNSWGAPHDSHVIRHGICSKTFQGWKGGGGYGLSIVNHIRERDEFCGWILWEKLSKKLPLKLIGENPGLSKSINSVPEIVSEINKASFYLNTSQLSPVPLSMIEAMMCGIPIVTTANQESPKIIQNGVNGYISNEEEEIVKFCRLLLENKDLAHKIGMAGREIAIARFGKERFVSEWNKVLYSVC